ncbi:MAG: hypothetical protein NTV22_05375 [bacterium]|nr:hypothetical protein [bacterium]
MTTNGTMYQADPLELVIAAMFAAEPQRETRAAIEHTLDQFRAKLATHPYVHQLDQARRSPTVLRFPWRSAVFLAAAASMVLTVGLSLMHHRQAHRSTQSPAAAVPPPQPESKRVSVTVVPDTDTQREDRIVRGHVTYASGQPATGTLVWAEALVTAVYGRAQTHACNPALALSGAWARTDATGAFAFSIAAAWTNVIVKTAPKGFLSYAACSLTNTDTTVQLQAVAEGGYFTGRFTGPDNSPVTNVTMWYTRDNKEILQIPVAISPDGRYCSAMIAQGSYNVGFIAEGYEPAWVPPTPDLSTRMLPMTNGERRLCNIRFDECTVVKGMVYNGMDMPFPGVSIALGYKDPRDFTDYVTCSPSTDENGEFQVRSGRFAFWLSFSSPGCVRRQTAGRTSYGGDARLVVRLSPGADMFVRVFDANGRLTTNSFEINLRERLGKEDEGYSMGNYVTNGILRLSDYPVHLSPVQLVLVTKGNSTTICKSEPIQLVAGTETEVDLYCPYNKLVVRLQPPIAKAQLYCNGPLQRETYLTKLSGNEWIAEPVATGMYEVGAYIYRPGTDSTYNVDVSVVLGTTNIFVGWYGPTYLDLQVQPPDADSMTNGMATPPPATGATYRACCRLVDKRGMDIQAGVSFCGKDGLYFLTERAYGNVNLTAYASGQGFRPGSHQLVLTPVSNSDGFTMTSIWFTVVDRDVDLGTIVLETGDLTITGTVGRQDGSRGYRGRVVVADRQGKTRVRGSVKDDAGCFYQSIGTDHDGRFVLRNVPADKPLYLSVLYRSVAQTNVGIGPFTISTDIGTIVLPSPDRKTD